MNKIASMVFILSMSSVVFQSHAAELAPKPQCPPGQIAKMEMGMWQCKLLDITSDSKPEQIHLLLPTVQKTRAAAHLMPTQPGGVKPHCPMGQIAKLEAGYWQCKTPKEAVPTKSEK